MSIPDRTELFYQGIGVPKQLWAPWPDGRQPEIFVDDGGPGFPHTTGTAAPTGYTSSGEMYVLGDMVWWTASIFAGGGFAQGNATWRFGLPYPVHQDWRDKKRSVGTGQAIHNDVPGALGQLGPSAHKPVTAHVVASAGRP